MNATRGSGIIDVVTPAELTDAVMRAYAALDDQTRARIDKSVDRLVAEVAARRVGKSSVAFGPVSALELLAAIGRMV